MATKTATVHLAHRGKSWSGSVTECGKKGGETTANVLAVTCQAAGCANPRTSFIKTLRTAARESWEVRGWQSRYDEAEAPKDAPVTVTFPHGGDAVVACTDLGVTFTIHTEQEADALGALAELLKKALVGVELTFRDRAAVPTATEILAAHPELTTATEEA